MREATIISKLRSALRQQGVWGARSERLIQEWTDHVSEDAAQRVEKGALPEAAQDAAWKALGNPEVLAAKAGSELARAFWSGRHPWLAGLALPALAWFTLVIAAQLLTGIAFQFWEIGALQRNHPAALLAGLRCWQAVFNCLPWLLSMAWLARIAVRMPGGWKLFWITAVVLTLCSTSMWMRIDPPLHGPNSGSLGFYASGVLGVIVDALLRLMGFSSGLGPWLSWPKNLIHMTPSLIQAAIMVLGLLAFHFKATARSEDPGKVQPS